MAEESRRGSAAELGPRDEAQPGPTSPTRSSRSADGAGDIDASTRRVSTVDEGQESAGIRRWSSAVSRRSGSGVPSVAPRTTLAERTQGKFTLAGPEDTSNLRLAQQPFVHPGYADLNPSYEQPANAKPVWSLAKPLPRVVRPAMVPTKEEVLQRRANPQLPAENSQRVGLDVDPNKLERGQIRQSLDPRKIVAQVEDARLQRENKFVDRVLSGDTASKRPSPRLSRTSSARKRRLSAWQMSGDQLSAVGGGDFEATDDTQRMQDYPSTEPLLPVSEEPVWHSDEEDQAMPGLAALQESAYPEDLHPLVQDLVEKEVHNNHTTWAVIRTHHREALAEALAVFVQLTIGFCADLSVTIANTGNPNTTQLAWGFATMMAIYISGGVSGAHLNPSITVMLWFYRGFPQRKMPDYFAAQFIGAFCAGLTAYGVYYASIQQYLISNSDRGIITSFVTSQREHWIGPTTAFFNEFLGTAFLVITVLALGDDQNAPPGAGMNSLIIGLVITCLSITFAYQTGAALNPSRDFGPRLALLALGYSTDLFLNPYWFYGPWAGSLSGAFMGAFLYDFMIFTGGESPINYPLERSQRAIKKGCMEWKRLFHRAKREVGNVMS